MGILGSKAWLVAAALQGVLAAVSLLALAFSPAEVGRTLLVPIDGKPVDQAVLNRFNLRRVANGPITGSIVVEGMGRPLAATLLDNGIVMMAAPAALCGGESSPGDG
jgi:hypothetical protein